MECRGGTHGELSKKGKPRARAETNRKGIDY